MNRHFIRCSFCERPLSVNVETREDLGLILNQGCPLCGEKALRYMGQVRKTDIIKQGVKSACDKRCTLAVGPKCDCPCNNENHGTHRLVVFDKVVGKLEVVERDLLNGNENYLARIKRMAAAKNVIKVNVIAFLNWKVRDVLAHGKELGAFWKLPYEEHRRYSEYRNTLLKIDKIEDLKSIQKKINALTALIRKIGTNLEYLEAIYESQHRNS
jgi:hypothetical protein